MKCPKCGYNSFEHNDACPKCAADVTGFKGTFGLTPLVFPQEVRTVMAESLMSEFESSDHGDESGEINHDMFSFDLPDDTPAQPAPAKNPFDFDDEPAPADSGTGAFSFDDTPSPEPADPFASLLESTSQSEPDSFAPLDAPVSPAAASPASPGEFDLNSFSWDETPVVKPAAAEAAKPEEDDFDSLFGDMDDADKK